MTAMRPTSTLTIVGGNVYSLPIDPVIRTAQLVKNMRSLLHILRDDGTSMLVQRRSPYIGGRLLVGDCLVVVVTDIDPELALMMLTYTFDGSYHAQDELIPTALREGDGLDISYLVAGAFVVATERAIQRAPLRAYVRRREWSTGPKGRPRWTELFSRPGSTLVESEFYELASDTPIQRALLAAATVAYRILAATSLGSRARRLCQVMLALTTPRGVTKSDLDTALGGSRGAGAQYRLPLILGKAILFDAALPTMNDGDDELGFCLKFNFASLFELVVHRYLALRFANRAIRMRFQISSRGVLLDGKGRHYASVRPDIVALVNGQPKAVLDCKFKPRYLLGARVSTSDLYQLFFYGEHVVSNTQGGGTRHMAIVSPIIRDEPLIPMDRRTIVAEFHGFQRSVLVLPFDVRAAIRGESILGVGDSCAELGAFLTSLSGEATNTGTSG